jgi:type I restriction enzyme S subunit
MIPYEKYKDSGVAWIGAVPEHWEVRRLKWIGFFRSGEGITSEMIFPEGDFPVFGGNGIRGFYNKFTHDGTFILIGRQGALCGNIQYGKGKFWASEHAIVVHPLVEYAVIFFGELLRSMNLNQYSVAAAQPGLSVEMIKNLKIPFPPLPEQTAIAHYLDQKTGEIDQLIAQKERLLALWEEEKTALINQAVTRGLDAGAKMKDSGVAWLGEVPEHWEVKKTKYLFKIQKRIVGELGKNILSITQKGIMIKDTSQNEGQIASDYSKYQIVSIGDFAANHMDLLTGYVDISQFEGVTSPDYRVFTLTDTNCESQYFLFLMQMGYKRKIFYGFGQGASLFGRWRFPTDEFLEFRFPVPPLPEQAAIVRHIETQTARIQSQMDQTRKLIELLKEYRATLISEVVTGKIKITA